MTRALAALGALAVVLAMMSPCLAQAGGGTAEAAPPAKSEYGQFAALPSLVKLTDEQQTKIKEAVAAANKTLLPDTEKMQKLAGDLGKANADGKKEEAQAIQMEMMTIGPRLQKGYAELGEKVLSALTDDQKLVWDGFCIRQVANMRLMDLKLTADQNKKIDEICAECAKEMGKVKDRSNGVAVMKVYSAANEKIQTVLTDEQKKASPTFTPVSTMPTTSTKPVKIGGG